MSFPRLIAFSLMLTLPLAGCGLMSRSPTTASGAIESAKAQAVAQAQTGATYCQIANKLGPLMWSKDDTRPTQLWAVRYNAVGRTRCGWAPPSKEVGTVPTQ